ncbi:MAG: SUMF1/EgtB/PvdO family nonheme iron enzyme [Chloroflexi bacterium]|nr:SUMF1/EgtB/PvdO family nonheme iron enzyme [Chloroflexota bacterium]
MGLGRKILRGGAWNNNQDNARCANRNRNNPHNRNNNVGFRVAESGSPILPEMRRVIGRAAAAFGERQA